MSSSSSSSPPRFQTPRDRIRLLELVLRGIGLGVLLGIGLHALLASQDVATSIVLALATTVTVGGSELPLGLILAFSYLGVALLVRVGGARLRRGDRRTPTFAS